MNIQELQFIATHHLPIRVLIINNRASGMIRSREIESGKDHLVHTTKESGYCALDVKKIAYAYRMPYKKLTENVNQENTLPVLYEFIVDECIGLHPFLPRGNRIYDLIPKINVDIFSELDILKDGG